MHEICEHVYHLLRAEARGTVIVDRDYDPSLPSAMLDRNQIIQALLNVARNALQAVGERGRIILRTRALSNVSIGSTRHKLVASLQVEDNGPGVPRRAAYKHFLSARHRPRQWHGPRARGRAGARDPPRRAHRVRKRARTNHIHTATAPG